MSGNGPNYASGGPAGASFPSQRQSLQEKQRDLQLVLQVPFTDASGEKTGWLPNASEQPFEGDCWGHKL